VFGACRAVNVDHITADVTSDSDMECAVRCCLEQPLSAGWTFEMIEFIRHISSAPLSVQLRRDKKTGHEDRVSLLFPHARLMVSQMQLVHRPVLGVMVYLYLAI
jgi:hypothetical protein